MASLPFDDRSFDLVNITNWDEQIIWDADEDAAAPAAPPENHLTTPMNKALESGVWTQSIIWGPREPFRDFTQLELHEQDMMQEERQPGKLGECKMMLMVFISVYLHSARGRPSTQAVADRHPTKGQVQRLQRPVLRGVEGWWPPPGSSNLRTACRRARISFTEVATPIRTWSAAFYRYVLTSTAVQDSTLQTRSTLLPSPSPPIPSEYRDPLQQSSNSKEEEGQSRAQGRERWRHRRRLAPHRRSQSARHE